MASYDSIKRALHAYLNEVPRNPKGTGKNGTNHVLKKFNVLPFTLLFKLSSFSSSERTICSFWML